MSYELRNLESVLQIWTGIDANKIQELEETVEILQEQIESLKLELCHKDYQLQEIKEELRYTNQDLCAELNLKQTSMNEAMKLAKNLLASNKPTEDILVELITAIYSCW